MRPIPVPLRWPELRCPQLTAQPAAQPAEIILREPGQLCGRSAAVAEGAASRLSLVALSLAPTGSLRLPPAVLAAA